MSNDEQHDDYISKSQKKREMTALQQLGKSLVALSPAQLKKMLLPAMLEEAIINAKTIQQHGAKRRQLQYLGRLMREVDADAIKSQFDLITQHSKQATTQLHKIERWRERLINEGDSALNEFIQLHDTADRQHLRQLIRRTQAEINTKKSRQAYRKLFQQLKECLE
ncbi:MAG: DUF615 domain-containing protein [Gammaproteobacteria bacterium]|nr:DUF615 domain-containing protein [Gammaproteobacteria bacterium]